MSVTTLPSEARRSIRRHLVFGVAAVLVLVAGAGGWAASIDLAGAVIAQGTVVVDSNVKTLQHPTGGVISEILVKEGDHVAAGDVVMRLDATEASANLQILARQSDELEARQARLQAEIYGEDAVTFPADLLARAKDPTVAELMSGETRLFQARRDARDGQRAQYQQQVTQLNQQIAGLVAQENAKSQEIALNATQLTTLRTLLEQHLTDSANVTSAARDAALMAGQVGQLQAAEAETRGKIAEVQLQVIQVDEDMRTADGKDLADIRSNLGEVAEKRMAADELLSRVDIRAPEEGTVHELAFHTVGGVVGAGQTIMSIVPDHDPLAVEARVRPQDIDQLHVGQETTLRFTAFNQRSTPELNGQITRISPDVVTDTKTGAAYYTARVALSADEIGHLQGLTVLPGMPVEAFVQTSSRSFFSYLLRPLYDQVARAFREN